MKVVTFGEIMLRLAPSGYLRLMQDEQLHATFGGSEANVAVSLANFGINADFVSKLPDNDIGEAAIRTLRSFGVDVSNVVRGGERIGIYYCEKGASQRGSKVIYDRSHSSIQEADPSEFDWKKILKGANWFHFSGITPALGKNMYNACLQACKAAHELGITVSCDINYRSKLWNEKEASKAMNTLCKYVDVCFCNEEDAKCVFGIEAENSDVYSGKLDYEAYKKVAEKLYKKFGFRKTAITLRTSITASENDWAAMVYDGKKFYISKTYHVHIVDRVGSGDAFDAGLIYGLLKKMDMQSAVEFATAAAVLKHSIEGDMNRVSCEEVLKLAAGNASGRVQR